MTATQIRFNDTYYEKKISARFTQNYSEDAAWIDSDSTHAYEYTNYNGTPSSYHDPYGVITAYGHDGYGNLTAVKTYKAGFSEVLEKTITYDSTNEALRELPVSIKENEITRKLTYDNPFLWNTSTQIESTPAVCKEEIKYDAYGERVKKIAAVNSGGNTLAGNYCNYDSTDKLATVKDTAGRKYNIEYEDIEVKDAAKYYDGEADADNLLFEQEIRPNASSPGCTQIKQNRHKDDAVIDTTEVQLDKYGKLDFTKHTQESNTYKNTYSYQNKNIAYSDLLEQVSDAGSDNTYKYSYGEDNKLIGYTVLSGQEEFVVRQEDGKTTCKIGEATRISQVWYENSNMEKTDARSKRYLSPRVYKTIDTEEQYINQPNEFSACYSYDELGRVKDRYGDTITLFSRYSYNNDRYRLCKWQTDLTSQFTFTAWVGRMKGEADSASIIQKYGYDGRNNMTLLKENGGRYTQVGEKEAIDEVIVNLDEKNIEYQYDELNRLVYEKHEAKEKQEQPPGSGQTEYTIKYDFQYDYIYNENNGNLENVTVSTTAGKLPSFAVAKAFTYDDKGRRITCNGNNITYDKYGNVINRGAGAELQYNRRNMLDGYEFRNSNTSYYMGYGYNYQGVRVKKTHRTVAAGNDVIYRRVYYTDGSRILGEDLEYYTMQSIGITDRIRYYYDAEGIAGISYSGKKYTFLRDAQGNVCKIMQNNKVVAEYLYDAYGNCTLIAYNENGYLIKDPTGSHVGIVNPFRWKGYYQDDESGLYAIYLNGKTRYYDPALMMFLDADEINEISPYSIGGLDRNSLGVPNPLLFPANDGNIFMNEPLFSGDVDYVESNSGGKNWLNGVTDWLNGVTDKISDWLNGLPAWAKWTIGGTAIGLSACAGKWVFAGAVAGAAAGMITASINKKGWDNSTMASGFMTGSLLGAAVGGVFGMGKEAITLGLFAVGDKLVADFLAFMAYDKPIPLFDELRWEDYAVAFALGGYTNLPGLVKTFGSPAVGQLVQMGTRGKSLDGNKYLFDVGMSIITARMPKSLKPTIKGFGSGFYYSITK